MEAAVHGIRRKVTLLVALASALLVGATASMASAGGVFGEVTIKGKLYLDGELTKVNCAGSDGNTIDVTTYGVRVFTIDSTCALFPDTGDNDEFRFVGQEETIVVNGKVKNILVFSGTEQGTGPALGAASSEEKFNDNGKTIEPTSEKGRMTYSYTFGSGPVHSVIFVGDFKAKF